MELDENSSFWVLDVGTTIFRIDKEALDRIMGAIRTSTTVPIVAFKDIYGGQCQVNMGHVIAWYESTPQLRDDQAQHTDAMRKRWDSVQKTDWE